MTEALTERSWWVAGRPSSYSSALEKPWKAAIAETVPPTAGETPERGVSLEFVLDDAAQAAGNEPDLDNMLEPLLSAFVNGLGWFSRRRPNIELIAATKCHGPAPGCQITLVDSLPSEMQWGKDRDFFHDVFPGPLPISATDSPLADWVAGHGGGMIAGGPVGVHLGFGDAALNLGDIATGRVKSVLDGLWPLLGGNAQAPDDGRIGSLVLEKKAKEVPAGGVLIRVAPLESRSATVPPSVAPVSDVSDVAPPPRPSRRRVSKIFVPTAAPEDWKPLLGDPEKHWRRGYSAWALAHSWEAADGFPSEVIAAFAASGIEPFRRLELLLAIPERTVPLPPGGARPSQTDLFVLAKDGRGELVAIAVEGKVSEPFGPTVAEWKRESSPGKETRLRFLCEQLYLDEDDVASVRYQLLHRTVSAIIEAERFSAPSAVMFVHSFSQSDESFDDFAAFAKLVGAEVDVGALVPATKIPGDFYLGWARGEERFLW